MTWQLTLKPNNQLMNAPECSGVGMLGFFEQAKTLTLFFTHALTGDLTTPPSSRKVKRKNRSEHEISVSLTVIFILNNYCT